MVDGYAYSGMMYIKRLRQDPSHQNISEGNSMVNLINISDFIGEEQIAAAKKFGYPVEKNKQGESVLLTDLEYDVWRECRTSHLQLHNGAMINRANFYIHEYSGERFIELSWEFDYGTVSMCVDYDPQTPIKEERELYEALSPLVRLGGGKLVINTHGDDLEVSALIPLSVLNGIHTLSQFKQVMRNCKFENLDSLQRTIQKQC